MEENNDYAICLRINNKHDCHLMAENLATIGHIGVDSDNS